MNRVKKVYLGADHGGYSLKEKMKEWLGEWTTPQSGGAGNAGGQGYRYEDCGNIVYDKDDDYPDYAIAVAKKVGRTRMERIDTDRTDRKWEAATVFGILGCRSAAGVVFAANKVPGVRAAAAHNIESARHMREHNDANIIAISGDWVDEKTAKGIIKAFLETKFSMEERHIRRLRKVEEVEKLSELT